MTENEKIAQFAETVSRGAVVHCSPDIYEAIQKDSTLVSQFAGVELRSSRLVPPQSIMAVQLDKDAPPISYRIGWVDFGEAP